MLQGHLPVNLFHIDIDNIDFYHPYFPDMTKLLKYLKFKHNCICIQTLSSTIFSKSKACYI